MQSRVSRLHSGLDKGKYNFCTYFDQHYLPRALALYNSLQKHCPTFHLFALCLDQDSYSLLETARLPHMTPVSLDELEQANPALCRVKTQRSRVEYYYTCGPSFLLYLLGRFPGIDLITYLDSDLYFFSSPKALFDELQEHSVGIIEHRLPTKLVDRYSKFGLYNVGWISFRRDQNGLECLRWWDDQCRKWCYDRVEDNKFADQKYLEQFPVRFRSVCVIQHKGANLAPWNIGNYRITERAGSVLVDDQPLVFFHFHGFKMLSRWLFDSNFGWYQVSLSAVVRQCIFLPYIQELRGLAAEAGQARTIRNRSRRFGFWTAGARFAIGLGSGLIRRAYIVSFP